MLAFAAAVQPVSEPVHYPTVGPVFGIALFIVGAIAGYRLGSLSLPRWSHWVAGAVWPVALAVFVLGLGMHDPECSPDPHTLTNAVRDWIVIPALTIAIACAAFFGRKVSRKHIIAAPISLALAGLGLLLAVTLAYSWLLRPCQGFVV